MSIATHGRVVQVERPRTVGLPTGSGVVALAAATLGASPVTAWDISAQAIAVGIEAEAVGRQTIPFGHVRTARARILEASGRSTRGCREETLVIIRADKSPNGPGST